jgi:enoyl-CoA hydratase
MKIERHDAVALLRIETGRANAIGPAWLDGMNAQLDALAGSDAKALVITGYDRFFSAGLDLPSLIPLDQPAMQTFIQNFSDTMLRLFDLRLPVVAAVNGHAVAGGCVLALQADYRMMADGDGKIGLNEVPLGIGLPAVVVETLRCQVPAASLMPIALEGRLHSPHEALELDLVHQVVAPEALLPTALEKAASLAALPSAAYAQVKRSLRRPVSRAIVDQNAHDSARWTETWFTEAGQARIKAAVARLKK